MRAAWLSSLKADGFLQDVVSDLSETEAVRTVLATRVRGAFATIGTRVELPAALSLEPFFQVKRVDYALIPGDYDESRGGFRLEWRAAPRLLFSLVGVSQDRSYATRQQHTAGGRPLAGTRMRDHPTRQGLTDATKAGPVWNGTVRLHQPDGTMEQLGLGGPAVVVHRPAELFARIGRDKLIGFGEAYLTGAWAEDGIPGDGVLGDFLTVLAADMADLVPRSLQRLRAEIGRAHV